MSVELLCSLCWSQLNLEAAIYYQNASKAPQKTSLDCSTSYSWESFQGKQGNIFLLYLSLLKELKSSRIESHAICRAPNYGRANSKKSFIQSVLRFGKALEFGWPQEAVERFSSLTVSAVSPQELPILAESLQSIWGCSVWSIGGSLRTACLPYVCEVVLVPWLLFLTAELLLFALRL